MALRDLLDELEKEITLRRQDTNLYINQPSLITVSSDSTNQKTLNTNRDSFFTFTCDLKKPAIGAKSLQLVSANIPQAKGLSFSDSELIFPYYRLRTQTNVAGYTYFTETPSSYNLYYVRLLPSYYPSNIIPNSQNYGFNRTFNNYQELSDELAKACAADLRHTNLQGSPSQFLPNDVLISYNETENKFQLTGNNINTNVTPGYPPVWSNLIPYPINAIVYATNEVTNKFFISKTSAGNLDQFPFTSPAFWDEYVDASVANTKIWNTYLVAGFDDPNVLVLQKNLYYNINAENFNINALYNNGDVVYYNDGIYESLIAENGGNPPSTSPGAWEIYTPGTSNPGSLPNLDFLYAQYGLPDIVGIPNQPFMQGKTLAKRMGFTWDGRFTFDRGSPTQPLYWNAGLGINSALLWNRMRPVPFYDFIPPDPPEEVDDPIPIPNNNPFTATTFIADAFCNLVYSSVLNIYSEITTASSVDTQSVQNILAMVPINCGQLGITFTNNFLENPLSKINSDIYQITIELRDEIGEPYYISNNGIVTLTLKITY